MFVLPPFEDEYTPKREPVHDEDGARSSRKTANDRNVMICPCVLTVLHPAAFCQLFFFSVLFLVSRSITGTLIEKRR